MTGIEAMKLEQQIHKDRGGWDASQARMRRTATAKCCGIGR